MSDTTTNLNDFLSRYKKWLIVGFIVLVVIIVGATVLSYVNNVRNDGIAKESALTAQYSSNQNELATYINEFNESLGISDRAANKVDQIILNAVQGRYKDTSATPGSGGLFSAIQEAYPDLTATTASYAKVQDLVESGRNTFKNDQDSLLDRIRDYNTWRNSGIFRSGIVSSMGFPTDNLTARTGDQVLHGRDALDKMSRIITNSDTTKAYQTGESDPLIKPEG